VVDVRFKYIYCCIAISLGRNLIVLLIHISLVDYFGKNFNHRVYRKIFMFCHPGGIYAIDAIADASKYKDLFEMTYSE
jgi:hypothetical protein